MDAQYLDVREILTSRGQSSPHTKPEKIVSHSRGNKINA